MAPLNLNSTTRTSYSRNFSGSLLAPSIAAIFIMLLFFVIGETAHAERSSTLINNGSFKTETTGPDGTIREVDVFGATDINGSTRPAGPIISEFYFELVSSN